MQKKLGVPAKKRSGFSLQSIIASGAWQSVEQISSQLAMPGFSFQSLTHIELNQKMVAIFNLKKALNS